MSTIGSIIRDYKKGVSLDALAKAYNVKIHEIIKIVHNHITGSIKWLIG